MLFTLAALIKNLVMVALKQDNKYDDDGNNIKKGPKLFVNYIWVTVPYSS